MLWNARQSFEELYKDCLPCSVTWLLSCPDPAPLEFTVPLCSRSPTLTSTPPPHVPTYTPSADSSMSRSFTSNYKYPTLYQVLFSPHTPYVPPQASPIAMFAWKQRIWIESTFGLVAMEPWEKYLVGQDSKIHPSGLVNLALACFTNCSNVPPRYFLLYDPHRSGCISSAILNRPWIQASDHLPPRHDDATKHHISRVMNDDLR